VILNLLNNMYDGQHPGTILMNVLWTLFNLIVLGVAVAVAWEQQQRRQTVRVQMAVPAGVVLADGTAVQGLTGDLSSGGVMMRTDTEIHARPGDQVRLVFPVLDGDATLPATVVGVDGRELRAHFDPLTTQEEEALTMVLYSRADTWLGWGESRDVDRPLTSMWRILQISIFGLNRTARGMMSQRKAAPKGKMATSIVPLLLMLLTLPVLMPRQAAAQKHATPAPLSGNAQPATPPVGTDGSQLIAGVPPQPGQQSDVATFSKPTAPGQFDNVFTLADVGTPETIVLRGVDSYHSVYFSVPQTQLVKTATMQLKFHFSPGLLPALSHLKVSLNGTLFADLPVVLQPTVIATEANDLTSQEKLANNAANVVRYSNNNALLVATLNMPADMLVHDNQLTFEFIGHYALDCEDPSNSTLWSQVDSNTSVELVGSLLPLQDDLKLLPLPFYDESVNLHPSVPMVFLTPPSSKGLQAAGIVASWFGVLTDYKPVHFPVSWGALPMGNAIVISENGSDLPAELKIGSISGPTVAIRTNPKDPYSKLLILTGGNADELLRAAQGLTLQFGQLAGQQATLNVTLPRQSAPDDAPRWMSTGNTTTVGDLMHQGDLQGDGSGPVAVYARVPPDL
jgi:cellulose synthase (UDP-forming)